MGRWIFGIVGLVYGIVLYFLIGSIAVVYASEPLSVTPSDASELAKRSSLLFIENRGQIANGKGERQQDIAFTTASDNVSILFRATGISYVFAEKKPAVIAPASVSDGGSNIQEATIISHRIDVEFVGAAPTVQLLPSGKVDEYFNYYYGHCPDGITNVPAFTRLVYKNLYPHIDLVFYTHGNRLKYDFVVRPGGDIATIAMQYKGLEQLPRLHNGAVQVRAPLGTIEEEKPYSYQSDKNGRQREIASQFTLQGYTLGFTIADYDRANDLIIDPGILWGTYIGGTLTDGGLAVATNDQGDIGLAGYTSSTNFPITGGAFQSTLAGVSADIFLAKLNSNGERLWTTYYGGSNSEYSGDYRTGIACDTWGNFIVVGQTQSSNFPVSQFAAQSTARANGDAFVVKFNGLGQREWATYCGGGNSDYARDVTVDDNGNVYMVGGTASDNFPIIYPFFNTRAGLNDAFWVKFDSQGVPQLARYFGGNSSDEGNAIAVDGSGAVYIAGETGSASLPEITNGFQSSYSGGIDAFVAKFNSSAIAQWSTYYGGNGFDAGLGLAADGANNIVLVGETGSSNMWVSANAQQSSNGGGSDAFIANFTSSGTTVQWATYLGGSGNDKAQLVRVDASNNIVVSGDTRSTNFPISSVTYQEEHAGYTDAFIARFTNDGARTLATYYGGNGVDECMGLALYSGYIIVAGRTNSTNLPATIGAFQKSNAGGIDAFLAKLGECSADVHVVSSGPTTICKGSSLLLDAGAGYSAYLWSNGATTRVVSIENPGTYAVTVVGSGGCQATDSIKVNVNPSVVSNGDVVLCTGETGILSALASSSAGNLEYRWFPSTGLSCATCPNPLVDAVATTTVYTVVVTDGGGCQSSTTVTVRLRETPPVSVSVQGDSVQCVDGVVSLLAKGGVAYEWWPAEGVGCTKCQGPSAVVRKDTTTYYVKVTFENGCSTIDSVRLYGRPRPIANAGRDTVVCQGTKLQLSASEGVAYRWEPADGLDCPTCPHPTVVVTQNREYTLTVIDEYGCAAKDKIQIRVRPDQPLVSSLKKLDFGDLDECESRSIRSVILTNTSEDNIQVNQLVFTDPAFAFVDAFGRPRSAALSIAPKASDTLYFLFMPRSGGSVTGFVTLRGEPCNVDYIFELKGQKKAIAMATNVAQVQLEPLLSCDNQWKDTTITIRNAGEKDIVVHASIPPPFSLVHGSSGPQTLTVRPADIATVTVRFQPGVEGVFAEDLLLAYKSGACHDTMRIGMMGVQRAPHVQAVEKNIVFPSLLGCQTSVDTTITLTNTGDIPVTITGADDNSIFSLVSLPLIEIPPKQSRSITVRFKSTTSGVFSKVLTFVGEPCNTSFSVSLEGRREGVQFALPDTLEFPDVVLCRNNSAQLTLPIANSSGGNIQGSIQSVVSSGPFAIAMKQGDTIGNGQVRNFSVQFLPTATGDFVGAVQVVLKPCDIVKTVWFRGKAVDAAISVSASSVNLGTVPLSGTISRVVVLRNTGTAKTMVKAIKGISAPFSVSTTPELPLWLEPEGTLLIHINYTGEEEGKDTTLLVVETAEPCTLQQEIRVQAETTKDKFPIITAAGINFGRVMVPRKQVKDVVVRNTGTEVGTITGASFAQGSSPAFSMTSIDPVVLNPGDSVHIPISFQPQVAGAQSAELLVASSVGQTTVHIEGIGIDRFYVFPSLAIPSNLQAHVRAKDVRIPVTLQEAVRLEETKPTGLVVSVKFNRTVFHFLSVNGALLGSNYVSNNDRIIEVHVAPPFTPGTPLFEIVGDVLLGNEDYTDFVIETVQWTYENKEYNILTSMSNGRLAVTGVCRNGGDRLVEDVGEFGISSITPNPSGGHVEITVHTIEYGETHLEVYSTYGKKAFSRVWIPPVDAKTNLASSTETIVLDSQLPSGIYQVVLRSPSRRSTAQMVIAK